MNISVFYTEVLFHLIFILLLYMVFLVLKRIDNKNKNVYLTFELFVVDIYSIYLFIVAKYILCTISSGIAYLIFCEITKKVRKENKG